MGKIQYTTPFLVDLIFFLECCIVSSEGQSTKIKTISDKNDCNPPAFLSRPVCKTESFLVLSDTKDEWEPHRSEFVRQVSVTVSKKLPYIYNLNVKLV